MRLLKDIDVPILLMGREQEIIEEAVKDIKPLDVLRFGVYTGNNTKENYKIELKN